MTKPGSRSTRGRARLLFSTPSPRDADLAPRDFVPPLSNEDHSQDMEEDEVHEVDGGDHDSAETPNQSPLNGSASSSPPLQGAGQKLFVGLAGDGVRDFEPRQPAFGKMVDIIRGRYNGNWTSVSRVPQTQKNIWFAEFEKCFYWTVSTNQMRKTFFHQAASHIRNVFKKCITNNKMPTFVLKEQWKEILRIKKTCKRMLHQSAVNKQNIASKKARDAGRYRGGSRKVTKWLEIMKKGGAKPKMSDVVRQLWQTPDGNWTGSRPAAYVEEFDRLLNAQLASTGSEDDINCASEQVIDESLEKELWIKACDGPRNGRIFALGEEGTALIRTGMANIGISKSQSESQAFQEAQIQPLKEEMKEIKSTLQEFMKQQQDQQKKFMEQFQLTMLQQLMQIQGGQIPIPTSNGPSSNPTL